MKVVLTIIILLLLPSMNLFAQLDYFEQGKQLFLENLPSEAASKFELAISENPNNKDAYLYLGTAYEMMELYDQAIATLEDGIQYAGSKRSDFYFEMGDIYTRQEKHSEAQGAYSRAIEANRSNVDAYFNRANSYIRSNSLESALEDYRAFVSLANDHPKRSDALRMIEALRAFIAAEEQRLLEAQRIAEMEEEARRMAEEERLRQEQERRQALLNSVLSSLETAQDDTSNISAGSEQIDEREDEFSRED